MYLITHDGSEAGAISIVDLTTNTLLNSYTDWQTYATFTGYELPFSDGEYQVYAKLKDVVGNVSDSRASEKVFLDTQAPANLSIQINDGGAATNNPFVTLSLSAEGADYYAVSLDGVEYTDWFTETEKQYYLGDDDGVKTIYLKAKDICNNVSAENPTAGITLDTTGVEKTLYRLTGGGTDIQNLLPQFSGNGDYIYFVAKTNGSGSLYKVLADGSGEPQAVVDDFSYASGYRLSPDETAVVYYELDDVLRSYKQEPMNDYAGRVRITDSSFGNDFAPCFDQDGTEIYFCSANDTNYIDIWKKDLISSQFTQVTATSAREESVVFANNKIAYEENDHIRLLDLSNGEETTIGMGSNPSLSSDASKIAYDYDNQIYLYTEDTGSQQITSIGQNGLPSISPDGTKIAFVSNRDGFINIWVKKLLPLFSGIVINTGDETTTDPVVTLTINFPGAVQMAFSNNGVEFSDWEPYGTEKEWELENVQGERTVLAAFKDQDGQIIGVTDTIFLDLPPADLDIVINNNAEYTHIAQVTLQTTGYDIERVCFSEDNSTWSAYELYQENISYTLNNAAIGKKTIYVKAEDSSYQESAPVSDTIILSNGVEIQEISTVYNADDTVTINAKAVNVLTGTVNGAECFVGTVGADGTGTAFTAVDGTFDSATEEVTTTLSGITPDTEMLIYLHGKEDSDEWGGCLEYKVYPPAESLLRMVAGNYKKIKTLQGAYDGKQWSNGSLLSEGIFSVRKQIPYKMRIDDAITNSFMIINGDVVYQKDFTSGREFRYVIGENQKNSETEEFYYYIESFILEHNLEITQDPSVLGVNKWAIIAYPKEEYPKAYESVSIDLDTYYRVIEKELYHFPVNDEIGDKILTHENICLQNGIYYPLKTTKTEDFQEKGVLKNEMVWTSISFNQVIDETYFDIPEEQ